MTGLSRMMGTGSSAGSTREALGVGEARCARALVAAACKSLGRAGVLRWDPRAPDVDVHVHFPDGVDSRCFGLAVVKAMLAAVLDRPLPPDTAFLGVGWTRRPMKPITPALTSSVSRVTSGAGLGGGRGPVLSPLR